MADAKLGTLGADLSHSIALLYAGGATPDDDAVERTIGTHLASAMEGASPPREVFQALVLTGVVVMGGIAGTSGDIAKIQDQIARCFLRVLSREPMDPTAASASIAARLGPAEAERWREHVEASFRIFPAMQALRTREEVEHFEAVRARFGIENPKTLETRAAALGKRSPQLASLLERFEGPLGFFRVRGWSAEVVAKDALQMATPETIVSDWGRAARARTLFITAEFLQASKDAASGILLDQLLQRSSLDELRAAATPNLNDALRNFVEERDNIAKTVGELVKRIDNLIDPNFEQLIKTKAFRAGDGTYDALARLGEGRGYSYGGGLVLQKDGQLHRDKQCLGNVEYMADYEKAENRGIVVNLDGERQLLVWRSEEEGYRALTAEEKQELRGVRALLQEDLATLQRLLDEACAIAAIPSRRLDVQVPQAAQAG